MKQSVSEKRLSYPLFLDVETTLILNNFGYAADNNKTLIRLRCSQTSISDNYNNLMKDVSTDFCTIEIFTILVKNSNLFNPLQYLLLCFRGFCLQQTYLDTAAWCYVLFAPYQCSLHLGGRKVLDFLELERHYIPYNNVYLIRLFPIDF